MGNDIIYLIDRKYYGLSKTFKQIADYVKENYLTVPFLSIKELNEKIGVSTASITRFSQEMGFNGYPDFQKEIQKVVEQEIAHMREIKKSINSDEDVDLLKKMIDLNIKTLQDTYTDDLCKSFNNAVDLIKSSRKVYIIGLRSSYTVAYYLNFMLSQFMDNIELLSIGTGDMYNRLSYINADDLLISICFAQCTKFTIQTAEYFKKNGCKIIAVTDSYSSPIAKKANNVLIVKNTEDTFSFSSALVVLNALVVRLGKIDKNKTIERIKHQEKVAIENGAYFLD